MMRKVISLILVAAFLFLPGCGKKKQEVPEIKSESSGTETKSSDIPGDNPVTEFTGTSGIKVFNLTTFSGSEDVSVKDIGNCLIDYARSNGWMIPDGELWLYGYLKSEMEDNTIYMLYETQHEGEASPGLAVLEMDKTTGELSVTDAFPSEPFSVNYVERKYTEAGTEKVFRILYGISNMVEECEAMVFTVGTEKKEYSTGFCLSKSEVDSRLANTAFLDCGSQCYLTCIDSDGELTEARVVITEGKEFILPVSEEDKLFYRWDKG